MSARDNKTTETWLEGYRWALEHLTDPGVLRDAARYSEERGDRLSANPEVSSTSSVEQRGDGLLTRPAPAPGPREAGASLA